MRRPLERPQGLPRQFLWDLLTFEKLITGTVVHLVYWAGLGIIGVIAFGVVGASVGVAIREGGFSVPETHMRLITATPVPEPHEWAMMYFVFGFCGWHYRSRWQPLLARLQAHAAA